MQESNLPIKNIMAEIDYSKINDRDIRRPRNILSFEVEDRFHAESTAVELTDRKSRIIPILIYLLDVLDEQKAKATFFVLGQVAQKFPEIVALIDARGHEVASHGHSHTDTSKMPPEKFVEEIQRARWILEDIVQKPVDGYKAAGRLLRKLDPEIIEQIADSGYRYFFGIQYLPRSAEPNKPAHVQLKKGNSIVVVPQSVAKKWGISIRFSENLRVYPLWFMQRAINSLNRHGRPAAINMKIWELDQYQQRPPGSDFTNYSRYGNLNFVQEKLLKILNDFEFTTINENLRIHLESRLEIDPSLGDL